MANTAVKIRGKFALALRFFEVSLTTLCTNEGLRFRG
jgi:hypothetical protein